MAYTTESSYTGNGSTTEFLVTFPFLESTDIKARVNGVDTSAFTVTGTTVTFTTAPPNTQAVLLYRDTDIDKTKVVFHAGASIRAQDLNNTSKQLLYAIQEEEQNTGGIAFGVGNKGQITVNTANSWVINNGVISNTMLAANSVDSDQYVNGSIDREHLAADIVDGTKIADDSINSEHYVDASIDHVHLSNDCIDGDNIQNDVINSEHYAAASIDNEHLADDAVNSDEIADGAVDLAHLSASGTKSSSTYLRGDNTWAALSVGPLRGFKTVKYTGAEVAYSNSWTDVTDLSITYTPTLSNSIIVLEAHLNISSRAQDQTSSLEWSNFIQQFIVTPTGGSAATVQEEQKFSTGASHQWGGNSSYGAFLEAKYHFYEEYTNSNTTEKTFKVQLKEVNGTLKVHDNNGHSYFTLKEYTP